MSGAVCVVCEVRPEAEETIDHRAQLCNTTPLYQMAAVLLNRRLVYAVQNMMVMIIINLRHVRDSNRMWKRLIWFTMGDKWPYLANAAVSLRQPINAGNFRN